MENRKPTGVGNVAINLINHMSILSDSIVIWTIDSTFLKPQNNSIVKVLQGKKSFFKNNISVIRAVWDQLVFPGLVKKSNIDVVFFPVQEGMLFSRVPQVVLLIDMAPLLNPGGVPYMRQLSYMTRVPFVLANSSAIITISQSVKQEILLKYPSIDENKIKVVHLGYDCTRFYELPTSDSILMRYGLKDLKYILYVGSICENKNIRNIIKSYMISDCADWNLVIAGNVLDYNYYCELKCFVSANNLGEKIKFIDYVGYDDLPALYRGSSLFIFPSFYEGFGLPILEAMACGVPVVTSSRHAMPEVAGDAAFLVDPDCVDKIAVAIKEVLTNNDVRNALVTKGLKRVLDFSWEKSAHQVLKICEEAMKESNPQ
ncbi:MAG: glycosyltransferase family 4 protein [Chitinophagaceae bacterium]|nr:glycosyltransferase family 4 protein [Chitinophagaceae bacterium]